MTPHQLLIVAIRLLAVFWVLNVLAQTPLVIVTSQTLDSEQSFTTAIWLGILTAIAVVLWLFPATFARVLLRVGSTPAPANDTPLGEWQALCFVAVGIYVLAGAVPDLAYWVILAIGSAEFSEPFTLDQKATFVATIIDLAIGLALVFGATGISSLITKLRRAGVPARQ